ncbi:energy transducer TonB [Mucilaginibacter sp.]|uniref:energy transducer TonB n=1 Tax=Mucilaginibacter sp. TaxID=1882438 RepID=UPI00326371D9
MKVILFLLMGLLATATVSAQPNKAKATSNAINCPIELQSEFPGGPIALKKFIAKNLKWPEGDIDAEGRVLVSFVIQKDGSTTDFRVIKSLHPAFDKAAVSALKKMPKWKPGMQFGKPVKCGYTVPLMFAIKED